MKIGIVFPQIELANDPANILAFAQEAERLGYHHMLGYDHPLGAEHADREPKLTGPYTEKNTFHDPLIAFAYVAGQTKTLELITGVLVLSQRQTALVARQAADIDLFSGGRLSLGVGPGWNWVEYQAMGADFHKRGRMLNEQIPLLRELWSGKVVDFNGEFHRIDRAALNPPPRRQIPVLVGGFADAAFRRGAKHGDGFIFGDGFGDIPDCVRRVNQYLEEEGRDPAAFIKHLLPRRTKDGAAEIEAVEAWRALGGTHYSVEPHHRKLGTLEAHLDFMRDRAEALRGAGLLPG